MTVKELREKRVVCPFCQGEGLLDHLCGWTNKVYDCDECAGLGKTSYLYRIARDYAVATEGEYTSFRDGFEAALWALEKES